MNVSGPFLGLLGPFNWSNTLYEQRPCVSHPSIEQNECMRQRVCERVRAVCDERSWRLSQANGLRRFATRSRAQDEFEFTRTNHSHRVAFTGTQPVRNPKKKKKKKEKRRREIVLTLLDETCTGIH